MNLLLLRAGLYSMALAATMASPALAQMSTDVLSAMTAELAVFPMVDGISRTGGR